MKRTEEDDFGQRDKLTGSGDSPFLAPTDTTLQWCPDFVILNIQESEISQHIFRPFPTFSGSNVPWECEFGSEIQSLPDSKRADQMVFLLDVGAHGSQGRVIEG